ncbi:MAG: hypothetical protein E7497_00245 [Ruminococcus sp.]|nr:hypothetical protein [Ruminococcus sp.]
MQQNFMVCQNCQNLFFPNFEETNKSKLCPHCNSELVISELTYEEYQTLPKTKRCKKCKRKYAKLFIKCPKCNQQLIKLSTENKNVVQQIIQLEQQHIEKQQNIPKCLTCGSTNIEKISDTKKAAGFLTVGVFSKNFGKTYHCKNCDYRW